MTVVTFNADANDRIRILTVDGKRTELSKITRKNDSRILEVTTNILICGEEFPVNLESLRKENNRLERILELSDQDKVAILTLNSEKKSERLLDLAGRVARMLINGSVLKNDNEYEFLGGDELEEAKKSEAELHPKYEIDDDRTVVGQAEGEVSVKAGKEVLDKKIKKPDMSAVFDQIRLRRKKRVTFGADTIYILEEPLGSVERSNKDNENTMKAVHAERQGISQQVQDSQESLLSTRDKVEAIAIFAMVVIGTVFVFSSDISRFFETAESTF